MPARSTASGFRRQVLTVLAAAGLAAGGAEARPLAAYIADAPFYVEALIALTVWPAPTEAQKDLVRALDYYFEAPAKTRLNGLLALPDAPHSVRLQIWPSFDSTTTVLFAPGAGTDVQWTVQYRHSFPPATYQVATFIRRQPEYGALGRQPEDGDKAVADAADAIRARLTPEAFVDQMRIDTFEADSGSCPAVAERLSLLEKLIASPKDLAEPPAPENIGQDGSLYVVDIAGDKPVLRFAATSSNRILAGWSEDSLTALDSCWRLSREPS